jgi:hypothetical protein
MIALIVCDAVAGVQSPARPPAAMELSGVVHVLGLAPKMGTQGTLIAGGEKLEFHSKAQPDAINIAAIRDVQTGEDSRRRVRGTLGTVASIAAPYGTGRLLSLFRQGVDVLTIEFTDVHGGLHGAIFTLPLGQAAPLKQRLIAMGARTTDHAADAPNSVRPAALAPAESPLLTTTRSIGGGSRVEPVAPPIAMSGEKGDRVLLYAVEVEPVESDSPDMPVEFRVALYENLLAELRASRHFLMVYRSGDEAVRRFPSLTRLQTEVEGFKRGSQRERELIAVAGATSIRVRARLTGQAGEPLADREVEGKVRFFGDDLHATYNLARNIAKALGQSR